MVHIFRDRPAGMGRGKVFGLEFDAICPNKGMTCNKGCEELRGAVLSGQKSAGQVSTEAESEDQIEGQDDYVEY